MSLSEFIVPALSIIIIHYILVQFTGKAIEEKLISTKLLVDSLNYLVLESVHMFSLYYKRIRQDQWKQIYSSRENDPLAML